MITESYLKVRQQILNKDKKEPENKRVITAGKRYSAVNKSRINSILDWLNVSDFSKNEDDD